MAGISVIRVPNNSDEDASEMAIRNLLSLSENTFEERIVFEQKFNDMGGVATKDIQKKESENQIINIVYNLLYQIELSVALLHERDRIDVTLWHAGGFSLLLPLVVSRILGHQVIVCVLGESVQGYLSDEIWENEGIIGRETLLKYGFAALVGILETLSFIISTQIIVFSEDITNYLTLNWFEDKIQTVKFNYQEIHQTKPVEDRTYPIIYFGRICELKGADRVGEAIRSLLDEHALDGPVLFVGDGNMRSELESELASYNVEFTGWLPRTTALDLVADSKLFVLPSRSEGLPKALLEAMARGTVPVITPVGDIPDVVSDGTNGILLDNASPQALSETLLEALMSKQSDTSSEAVRTIRERFSYQSAKQDFESIIGNLDQ